MCGTQESPLLKLKAAKTKVLLRWGVELLSSKGGRLILDAAGCQGTELLTCGEALLEFYAILASEARQVSEDAFPVLEAAAHRACESWENSGNRATMKWHILSEHLVPQMKIFGNCLYTHNYADESANFQERERANFLWRPAFAENLLAKWYVEFMECDCW